MNPFIFILTHNIDEHYLILFINVKIEGGFLYRINCNYVLNILFSLIEITLMYQLKNF
jgi:hypothetical protein